MKKRMLSPTGKKWMCCLPLLLLLLLPSCGGEGEPSVLSMEEEAGELLSSGAFSETLEPLEREIAMALYGLEEAEVLDCAAYLSTGATAEECTCILAADEESAAEVKEALETRVEEQLAVLTDYQPAEVEKLENAVIDTQKRSDGIRVRLVVSAGEL